MNHLLFSKFKAFLFVFSITLAAVSFSCKSSSYSELNDQAAKKDTISQADVNESHEDLLTVDYKQFYDELAPHGEWIEVTSNDLKSEEPGSTGDKSSDELNEILKDRSSSFPKITFGDLFGVKDAAAADVNVGAFFVWRPDPSMAVAVSTGAPVVEEPPVVAPAPMYRPYTNGQWIASDEGWYFKAPTPYEEIVHHYGRWAYSPAMGWVWVPGRVRSPAWVEWREDDDNIAWTPVAPDVYVVNNVISPAPVVYEDRYVVVEKRYFIEPVVYQHVYVDKFRVKDMRRLNGIFVRDRIVCNRGPEFVEIERHVGRPIAPYNVITMNNDFRNTWIENNRINTFAPTFTRVKEVKNRNVAVTQPEKFNNFQEVWNRENRNNSAGNKNKVEDIGKLQNDKQLEKRNDKLDKQKEQGNIKQKESGRKMYDDSEMKKGNKNNQKLEKRDKLQKDVNKNKDGNVNKQRKERPQKDVRKYINKNRDEKPRKDFNRERKSTDKQPKKEGDIKQHQERNKDNPRGNSHDSPKDNPHKDKKGK